MSDHDPWHTPARLASYARRVRQGEAPKAITHPLSAPGIETSTIAYGVEYKGTPDALVSAGLALLEWLPGQPGCKNIVSLTMVIDGRRAYFSRNVKQEYFARYCWTDEEREKMKGPAPIDGRPARIPFTRSGIIAFVETLDQLVTSAQRDYKRSLALRKRNYDQGSQLCARTVNGVPGRAHGWCVDFFGSAEELVEAGLALPTWFIGDRVCRRVTIDDREIELYRPGGDEFELSIPYRKGDAKQQREVDHG